MTEPVDLEAMEKLHAATTQGNWIAYFARGNQWTIQAAKGWLFRQCGRAETVEQKCAVENDAAFIAAAHNEMPRLIAELRDRRRYQILEDKLDYGPLTRAEGDELIDLRTRLAAQAQEQPL